MFRRSKLRNSGQHYGGVNIVIHWLSALVVFGVFGLGLWMRGLDYYHEWYHTAPLIHQSIGVLLVLVTLFRLFWRKVDGVPSSLSSHQRWEVLLATMVHWLLYVSIISMVFSGYLIATAKGQPMGVFWFELPALITGIDNLESIAAEVHEITAFTIIGVAGLHGLAALKHHFVDKDKTLKRMLGIHT